MSRKPRQVLSDELPEDTDVAWDCSERMVDVSPRATACQAIAFVSRSRDEVPCFPCLSYSIAKVGSDFDGVFLRVAVVPVHLTTREVPPNARR